MINKISTNLLDIAYLDTLAAGNSPLHRLDARAKLIVTLSFIVAVVSFDRYAVSALMPFMIYPVVLIVAGRIPAGYLLRKVLLISPLALLVGIFNPLIDREVALYIGGVGISGGWVSFLSILLRFFLTVTAALAMIAVTGFNAICEALIKLGVPRPFVVQLLFFYRYLFVLGDEAGRMVRARALRNFDNRAMSISVFGSLAGHLLLRTLERAESIYHAMLCRGFDGHVPMLHSLHSSRRDLLFVLAWLGVFLLFRFVNLAQLLGEVVTGLFA